MASDTEVEEWCRQLRSFHVTDKLEDSWMEIERDLNKLEREKQRLVDHPDRWTIVIMESILFAQHLLRQELYEVFYRMAQRDAIETFSLN